MSEELLPCPVPWCDRDEAPRVHSLTNLRKAVVCNDCSLIGPHADTEAEARALWNTRTPHPAPERVELVERVARALFDDQWLDDDGLIPIPWEEACTIEHDAWRRSARAAIAAISTPDTPNG